MSTKHEIPLVKLEIVPSQTEVREESVQASPKFQEPQLNLFLESTSNPQEKGKCSEKKKSKQNTEYRNVRTIPRNDRNKVPVSYEISDTKYMYKIVPSGIPKTDRKSKKSRSSKGPRISTKLFSRLLTISGPVEQPNPSKENRKSRSESKKRDIKILKDAEKKEKKRRKKHGRREDPDIAQLDLSVIQLNLSTDSVVEQKGVYTKVETDPLNEQMAKNHTDTGIETNDSFVSQSLSDINGKGKSIDTEKT